MTRTIISDFGIILLLIIVVKRSTHVLDNLYPGTSWLLGTALLVALVPAVLSRIGQALLRGKRYRAAEEFLRLAIPLRRAEAILPLQYFARLYLSNLEHLATSLREQQRYEEALKISDKAVRFAEKSFGSKSATMSECLINRCGLLSLMGELLQAEEVAQKAVDMVDERSSNLDKRSAENLCLMLNNLGLVFANAGKPDKADAILKRAFALKEATFGKDSPQMRVAYGNQGYAYLKAGNYLAAEEYLKHAIKLGENHNDNTLLTGNNWNNLGDALRGKGELEQAELALKEALRIRQLTLPNNHPHMGYSYNNFGKLYCDQGKFKEAQENFEKALKIREAISAKHPEVTETLRDYAILLRKMDRAHEAEKLEERANAIMQKKPPLTAAETTTNKRDSATNILVRTLVTLALIVLIPLGSIMFVELRPPEKVPEGLSAQRYYLLGVMYKGAGWTELARDALNQAIKLDPTGNIGLKSNIFLKTKVPRYPVSKEAEQLNIRGFNEKASGDDVKAISTYEECIKLYPDFEWPYSNLGSLYLDRGDTAKAEELLKEAIAINPNYVNALVALAKTKRKQNDPTAAQKYIDTARACVHGDSQMEDMVNKSADN